jgi:hypothetical protein
MSKTEETLSGEQIREWAKKDLVITEHGGFASRGSHTDGVYDAGLQQTGIYYHGSANASAMTFSIEGDIPTAITRYSQDNSGNNRRIGYIDGVNSDGSFHIYILGNSEINLTKDKGVSTQLHIACRGKLYDLPPSMSHYIQDDLDPFEFQNSGTAPNNMRSAFASLTSGNYLPVAESFMYVPTWSNISNNSNALSLLDCCYYRGSRIAGGGSFNLSRDISDTIELGKPMNGPFFMKSEGSFYIGDKDIGGDLHGLGDIITTTIEHGVLGMPAETVFSTHSYTGSLYSVTLDVVNMLQPFEGTCAYHYLPYNLILTYDYNQAREYVENGTLPSDAFLYPFDVDNIPINEKGLATPDDSDGSISDDSPNTGGDSGGEDTDDQNTEAPTNTPQALTNNNLYWLTSTQLKNFIEWFWTDATDVTDPQELFEKIQGLYSDLSQAIVSIRYMPIDAEWIGGTTIENSIIVGLVEKTEQVRTINKTVAPVRDITPNDISISELPDFKGFINFSPYCEISLYLPFYGYLSLDADLLMQNKLRIKATYDILSGTIQYYIFRVSSKTGDATMINTVTGKMAVDIPISLQTKNERDSMIFNNVASATANLIGAGASAVAGNPIGMVMSTSAIAGQQSQGAPMRVMGTIGESGAFYDHGYCAIFIKRPATNYPPQYARRVGYPYNGARKLEKTHGFVQCFNPYVEFTHMTVNENDIQPPKPTAEEIETIYNALTEGVILP